MKKKLLNLSLLVAMSGALSTMSVVSSCSDDKVSYIKNGSKVSYWLGTTMTSPKTEIIDGEEYEFSSVGDEMVLLRIEEGKDPMYKNVGIGYYDSFWGMPNFEEAVMKSTDQTSGSIKFPGSFGIGTYNYTIPEEGVMDGIVNSVLEEPVRMTFCKVANSDEEFKYNFLAEEVEDDLLHYALLGDIEGGSKPFDVYDTVTKKMVDVAEFLSDTVFDLDSETRAIPVLPFNPMEILDAISGIGDKIDDLAEEMEYYFTMVLAKLEIIDAKLDIINAKLDGIANAVSAVYVQQQQINVLDAKNKRWEKISPIKTLNDLYLSDVDTLLNKLRYLKKHPDEDKVFVDGSIIPIQAEEDGMRDTTEIEQALCQKLDSWYTANGGISYSNLIGLMEFLQDYSTVVAQGFPALYDVIVYNSVPWESLGYNWRAAFRLADLDFVMKSVHLAGLYQNRVLKHLQDADVIADWTVYFPNTDITNNSLVSKITAEKRTLKETYEKFKAFYKQPKIERHDDVAICQIQGATMRLEKQFHTIDYVGRPWYPNGGPWTDYPVVLNRLIYGFGNSLREIIFDLDGDRTWAITKRRCITMDEAQAIKKYYAHRGKNFYQALKEGGIGGYDWKDTNSNAILLGTGLSFGKSGERRVVWVDSFFGGHIQLRYGDKSDDETGGWGREGDTHMGAFHLNGSNIEKWVPNVHYNTQYISILKK